MYRTGAVNRTRTKVVSEVGWLVLDDVDRSDANSLACKAYAVFRW